MAISQHESGSQTATVTTEHTLNTTTPELTDGIFQFVVDVSNLANGDTVEFRIKEKATATGDTQRVVFQATLSNVVTENLWVSPSLILLFGWDFTLKQTIGTGRVFKWSIRKVA